MKKNEVQNYNGILLTSREAVISQILFESGAASTNDLAQRMIELGDDDGSLLTEDITNACEMLILSGLACSRTADDGTRLYDFRGICEAAANWADEMKIIAQQEYLTAVDQQSALSVNAAAGRPIVGFARETE